MVDLVGQHAAIQPELNEAMQNVIDAGTFINGPDVRAFAQELSAFTGTKHIIPCGNGTDALQIALMALGVGPGDEVITTGFTFISTVEVVALLGAKPVLVDVHPDTFNIQAEAIEKAITSRTKAIVPVHLFGQMADMDAIMAISNQHGIPVVEDNAQAINARWYGSEGVRTTAPQAGTLGHFGTTSFFPSKNLGCMGDGGVLMTSDDRLAKAAQEIANHGMAKRYHHDVIGLNSRLDTLQAAVLRIKLRHLDSYCEARQAAAARYDAQLSDVPSVTIPFRDVRSSHVFHQYTLQVPAEKRDGLVAYLAAQDIPSGVYYPIPGHRQSAFRQFAYDTADFPISEQLSKTVISLPMHTELLEEQQSRICDALIKFVSR